jgi:Skp family chaperone for outer membrane proteins
MSSSKLFKLWKPGVVILVALLVIALPVTILAKKTMKVGYYDLEMIQKELPEYQQLRDSIKQKQAELETLRGNLYREYQLFYQEATRKLADEKKGKSPEEQGRLDKQLNETLQQKVSGINRQIEQKKQENERLQAEQTSAIRENLKRLIAVIAAKKKLDLVVEKKDILYGETDITSSIISQAKKEAEKAKKEAEKAARVTITPKPTPTPVK